MVTIGQSVIQDSVVPDSLQSHGLQHKNLRACSNSCTWVESVMPSNHFSLWGPLLLLPSMFPSIRVFSNESLLPIRWPKYWSFSVSISPSNENWELISFRIDWVDLVVQGTIESLLQHHSSKHQFFGTQFLHGPTLTSIHDYWRKKKYLWLDGPLSAKECLCFLIWCLGWP